MHMIFYVTHMMFKVTFAYLRYGFTSNGFVTIYYGFLILKVIHIRCPLLLLYDTSLASLV
jgi:hypothetical protein